MMVVFRAVGSTSRVGGHISERRRRELRAPKARSRGWGGGGVVGGLPQKNFVSKVLETRFPGIWRKKINLGFCLICRSFKGIALPWRGRQCASRITLYFHSRGFHLSLAGSTQTQDIHNGTISLQTLFCL